MKTLQRWSGSAVLAVAALGCGSKPQFADQPPPPDGGAPPPAAMVDAGAPAPQAAPCDPVQQLAMTTTLQGRANVDAPGMKPEGTAVCGVLPEGQTVSGPMFLLEQGYCYTFLGQSLPPVQEVDMELVLDLGSGVQLPPALAAMAQRPLLVDTEMGEKASAATKQNCFSWVWPVPGQVRLVVKATKGSGPVAAQAFKKKKF